MGYLLLSLVFLFPCVTSDICLKDVCTYQLTVQRRRTMTYMDGATYAVVFNDTRFVIEELYPRLKGDLKGKEVPDEDVIAADGYLRDIIVINQQFPGPTIEVMLGAKVVIEVINMLHTETITIHWHGINHHAGTPYMDGAAYINQCPIQAKQKFVYEFTAEPVGTHWYHSHNSIQKMDGLFGMFVVHEHIPSIPNIALTVTDWYHADVHQIETAHPYVLKGHGEYADHWENRGKSVDGLELSILKYKSTLIDGRGSWLSDNLPLRQYTVIPGESYRFRIVCSSAEYSYELRMDHHDLTVLALDGQEIIPFSVQAIIIHPGERVDFEVAINNVSENFFFTARTLNMLNNDTSFDGSRAILTTNVSLPVPDLTPQNCTKYNPCKVFNCPFRSYPLEYNKTCVSLHEANSDSNKHILQRYGANDKDIIEIFVNMAFSIGASVNARQFVTPRAPLTHLQDNMDDYITACDEEECKSGCRCTNIITLPYNKTIQMVLMNFVNKTYYNVHHSAHIHGHNFAVMAMGYGYGNLTMHPDITCDDPLCTSPRWTTTPPDLNTKNPPVKDTVIVPSQGYIVTRFRSDNPGYWLLHCHQDTHLMEGMALVFNEAHEHHFPLPDNFPECYDFKLQTSPTVASKADQNMCMKSASFAGMIIVVLAGGVIFTILAKKISTFLYKRRKSASKVTGTVRSLKY